MSTRVIELCRTNLYQQIFPIHFPPVFRLFLAEPVRVEIITCMSVGEGHHVVPCSNPALVDLTTALSGNIFGYLKRGTLVLFVFFGFFLDHLFILHRPPSRNPPIERR